MWVIRIGQTSEVSQNIFAALERRERRRRFSTSAVVVVLVSVVASNRVHAAGLVLGLEVGLTVGPLPVVWFL